MNLLEAITSLRIRNYRLFWIGQIVTLTGTWMHQAAQGWLVFELTDSPFFLGLTGTAASLPILLFTLGGGVMADRHFKRNIMIVTHIIVMILVLILAALVSGGIITIWYVLILTFLIGTANAFEIPARQSFIVEMVGRENILNAIALNSTAFHFARMIGPAIAGMLMATIGLASCFFVNSLTFLVLIGALMMMRFNTDDVRPSPKKGVVHEFIEGLKYIRGNREIFMMMIAVGVISFFGFPYVSFLPVYARDIFEVGPTGLGILMGCAGAGAFTGAIALAFKGKTSRKGLIIAISGVTFSIALLVFSLSENLWLSYTMLFLIGFSGLNNIATTNSMIQLTVPNELRGRVMGSFTTMFLGMAPLGNFVLGSLAHYASTQKALTTGAIFCLLGTSILLWKKHSQRVSI